MLVLRDSEADLNQAIHLLRGGSIVAVPTETVYGLAADSFNTAACKRVFTVKNRPLHDPLIVHAYDLQAVQRVAHLNETARKLAEVYWPGPLTLVLPKQEAVPDIVTSNLSTVAVRVPRHPLLRIILYRSGLTLAAPSANPFGYVSPTNVQHVIDTMGNNIDAVVDGGQCEIGLESTIADVTEDHLIKILRTGAIKDHELKETLSGNVEIVVDNDLHTSTPKAPGQLLSHYSPQTPLFLFETGSSPLVSDFDGILFFRNRHESFSKTVKVMTLCENGSLQDAARNLYKRLREMDQLNLRRIWVEKAPSKDIGIAINDRLLKASRKK